MDNRNCISISATANAFIYAALILLLFPMKWILAAALAAVIHELCHYAALKLTGAKMYGLSLHPGGILMETEALTHWQELICSLAGPAGSLLTAAWGRYAPELAICAGIHGIYNLLPIYPLDGGRAVRSLLGMISPSRSDMLSKIIQQGTVILILVASVIGLFRFQLGLGILIPALLVAKKGRPRKTPCKDGRKRVQ